jgi:hypothetical protein
MGFQVQSKGDKRLLEIIQNDYGYLPEELQPKNDAPQLELNYYERGHITEQLPSWVMEADGSIKFLDTRLAEEQAREEIITYKQAMRSLLSPIIGDLLTLPGQLRESLIRTNRVQRLSQLDLCAELYDSIQQMEAEGVTKFAGIVRFARAYCNIDLSLSVNSLAVTGKKTRSNLSAGPKIKKTLAGQRHDFVRKQAARLYKAAPVWRGERPQTVAKELQRRQLKQKLIKNKLLDKGKEINVRTIAGYLGDASDSPLSAE